MQFKHRMSIVDFFHASVLISDWLMEGLEQGSTLFEIEDVYSQYHTNKKYKMNGYLVCE